MIGKTKRKYAHELYPLAKEGEVRPLQVEVPCQYALAMGFEVEGTDWFDLVHGSDAEKALAFARTTQLINQRMYAFLLDALLQGMSGQEAFAWASERADDETGEIAWDRAVHYGVRVDEIRPYPVLAEAKRHRHWTPRDAHGCKVLIETVLISESECPECTECTEEDA